MEILKSTKVTGDFKMHILYVITSIMLLLVNIRAECPHIRTGLLKWSSASTWGSGGKPTEGQSVEIVQNILLDETPPSLSNITIKEGASLVFNPEVKMEVRAKNIFVQGTMEIGSEDCPYNGSLTITLTGNRQSHLNKAEGKVLMVEAGGTLELHGEPRRSWTKLNKTLLRPQDTNDVHFDHESREEYTNFTTPGIIAYTLKVVGSEVTVIKSGLFSLKRDSQTLADQINAVNAGEVLMMAGLEKIGKKDVTQQKTVAYEAIETLVHGEVTGTGILRSVSPDGDTWAFIYKKGTPSSYREVTQPFGTTSSVKFIESDDAIFTAESVGAANTNKQTVTFRIANINATNQLLHMMDDVTTWRPGDKIVIASTDYDWAQEEQRKIVLCPECNNYQIRIDKPVKFVHYGKVLYNAIDMRAEVMLMSRKVVIRGEMEPTCPEFNGNCDKKEVQGKDTFGANTLFANGFKNVHIENIEIYNAGQQTDLGRYPLHFHMCFNSGESVPYIKGCSIHDTFARCVTIHGTHGILVMDNACYNHMGHGYYLEDGGEQNNTFDGNLAMTARKGTGALEPSDADNPAGFWITNPLNYVRNNIAAGGEGFGLWVIFPAEPFPPSKQYNLMAPFIARSTNLLEFTNNLAHSNDGFGMKIGGRLLDKRIVNCCNLWRPLLEPTENKSTPIDVTFSHLTGYKNSKFNIWLEGSLLKCTKISVADSSNGIIASNERLLRQAGSISYSVIVGDSENVGLPEEGFNIGRSLPRNYHSYRPHSGISMWRGPVRYHHLWFHGFTNNGLYDNAAIAKKRADRYYFTITNNYKDILYTFDDKDGVANLAISGTKNTTGWENSVDAEQVAGFTWNRNTENGVERWYVVRPDPLSSAGADCRLRPHWRLAMCKTKYGNFRVSGRFFELGAVGVYVRDEYPGAQLSFVLEKSGGPQAPMDGSQTYTFHTVGQVPPDMEFTAEGIETGDVLRIGACIPPGVDWKLSNKFPYKLKTTADFIKVSSLAELDAKEPGKDGKKYFFDNSTRMLYYKFIGHTVRAVDDNQICGGGKCPSFFIHLIGNLTGVNGDCRQTLYGSRLSDLPPPLPTITETFMANSGPNPPEGYGHGPQRPYSSRSPVKGKYGQWSEWSACSTTCGRGFMHKTRECNNPLPEHDWSACTGSRISTNRCSLGPCE